MGSRSSVLCSVPAVTTSAGGPHRLHVVDQHRRRVADGDELGGPDAAPCPGSRSGLLGRASNGHMGLAPSASVG